MIKKLIATIIILVSSQAMAAQSFIISHGPNDHKAIEIINNPNVTGASTAYYWSDLETTKGDYDFSKIDNDIRLMKSMNKKLVIMIRDKSFRANINPVPGYLNGYTYHSGNGRNRGTMVKRWIPEVSSSFRNLLRALGERYKIDSTLVAVKTSETALAVNSNSPEAEDYIRSMANEIVALGSYFPNQQTYFYMNWMPGGTPTMMGLAEVAEKYNVGLGGPDVHPDVMKMHSYRAINTYKNKIPVMMDVQWSNYKHTKIDGDTEELYEFATGYLGAKIICWQPRNPFIQNMIDTINRH